VLAGLFLKKNLDWFILERPNFFGRIMLLIFSKFNIRFIFIDRKLKKKFNFKKSSIFVPNINIKFWKKFNIIKKKKYFLITTVGNINKSKNHVNLVKFLNQSKIKFYLYIIGEKLINQKKYFYKLKKEVDEFNKKNDSKIFLKGRKNKKQIKSILNYTDLFILPSLTEGLSISLLEAMSMKCICLVSSNSNNSGIINNRNGFIYNLNKESFNKALYKIYNLSATKKNCISQNARTTVKNLIMSNSFFKLNKN
jgi:glycogen synthase